MKIDRLKIENFKKFDLQELDLNSQFTLLIGNNGVGKTSILDAIAVAIGVWHKAIPGGVWRNIQKDEVRLKPQNKGDRVFLSQFYPQK